MSKLPGIPPHVYETLIGCKNLQRNTTLHGGNCPCILWASTGASAPVQIKVVRITILAQFLTKFLLDPVFNISQLKLCTFHGRPGGTAIIV